MQTSIGVVSRFCISASCSGPGTLLTTLRIRHDTNSPPLLTRITSRPGSLTGHAPMR